jgi:hypothetical protein
MLFLRWKCKVPNVKLYPFHTIIAALEIKVNGGLLMLNTSYNKGIILLVNSSETLFTDYAGCWACPACKHWNWRRLNRGMNPFRTARIYRTRTSCYRHCTLNPPLITVIYYKHLPIMACIQLLSTVVFGRTSSSSSYPLQIRPPQTCSGSETNPETPHRSKVW